MWNQNLMCKICAEWKFFQLKLCKTIQVSDPLWKTTIYKLYGTYNFTTQNYNILTFITKVQARKYLDHLFHPYSLMTYFLLKLFFENCWSNFHWENKIYRWMMGRGEWRREYRFTRISLRECKSLQCLSNDIWMINNFQKIQC